MQLLHGRNQPIMLGGPGRGRGPKGRSRFPKGREGVGQPDPSPPARGYEGMLVRGRALAAKRFSCILEAPVLKPVGCQFWRGGHGPLNLSMYISGPSRRLLWSRWRRLRRGRGPTTSMSVTGLIVQPRSQLRRGEHYAPQLLSLSASSLSDFVVPTVSLGSTLSPTAS